MRLNKNHPDCQEYKQKWDEIVTAWKEESAEVQAQNRDFRGLDGPVAAVDKKYSLMLSALQKEYRYLYE